MKSPLGWCLLTLAAITGAARAQDTDESWVGRRVFTRYGTVLKVGNTVVDDEGRSASLAASGRDRRLVRTYHVDRVGGKWLWLKDDKSGVAGWVRKTDVIPYDRAIDFYTNRIRLEPSSSAYNDRAAAWMARGEHDIAIADLNDAIRLDPDNPSPFISRGIARHLKQEYDKAIADYNEAIRLDPREALAYRDRGDAWIEKHDYNKAIADYNEAIRLDPKSAITFHCRGYAWKTKKDYAKAIADFDEAIRLDPGNAEAFDNRGDARLLRKEFDGAIADYSEAIRIDPKFATAYLDRGYAWREKGDYDRAVADYDESIRLNPKYAQAYNNRAWLLATCPQDKHRDGKKAIDFAIRACELTDWKDAYELGTLAASYAEDGQFDKAVEWQGKAVQLSSGDDKAEWQKRLDLYRDKKPYRDVK